MVNVCDSLFFLCFWSKYRYNFFFIFCWCFIDNKYLVWFGLEVNCWVVVVFCWWILCIWVFNDMIRLLIDWRIVCFIFCIEFFKFFINGFFLLLLVISWLWFNIILLYFLIWFLIFMLVILELVGKGWFIFFFFNLWWINWVVVSWLVSVWIFFLFLVDWFIYRLEVVCMFGNRCLFL